MKKRVVIIGAGPAGLSSAHCLALRNLDYILLEQGPRAAAALHLVDPEVTLLSPTRLSRLPDMSGPWEGSGYLSFAELAAALDLYQRNHNIPVVVNASVTSVAYTGDRFVVRYLADQNDERAIEATHVINATGLISHPSLPDNFDPTCSSFRWMHSLDVRTSDLVSARALLVVGGGQSAGEVLERWLQFRSADSHAWLSLRRPLRAIPHRILGIDFHYLVWLPEHLPSHIFGFLFRRFREPMVGLTVARAMRGARILRRPAIATYRDREVSFVDGQRVEPDLVVFATGFHYAAEHLGNLIARRRDGTLLVRNCESTRVQNLFWLGFRFSHTLASPYLRGIARDARYVAARIAERR